MKRFIAWALVLMLCIPCALAEEIAPLAVATPVPMADPNEIAPLVQATAVPPSDPNEIGEWIQPAPAAGGDVIEDIGGAAAPAAVGDAIENTGAADPDAIGEAVRQLTASGETVSMKNVKLAVPTGWSLEAIEDTTATGGGINVRMNGGAGAMMQASSQPIGTEEDIKQLLSIMSAESFLSDILVNTMQGMGVVVEAYQFETYNEIACVRTGETVSQNGVMCAMNVAVMLDGTNMAVLILMLPGYSLTEGAAALDTLLSPMAAQ